MDGDDDHVLSSSMLVLMKMGLFLFFVFLAGKQIDRETDRHKQHYKAFHLKLWIHWSFIDSFFCFCILYCSQSIHFFLLRFDYCLFKYFVVFLFCVVFHNTSRIALYVRLIVEATQNEINAAFAATFSVYCSLGSVDKNSFFPICSFFFAFEV